jgi:type IV pilus assembly protein PilP
MANLKNHHNDRPLPQILSRVVYSSVLVVGALALSACGNNMSDLQEYVRVTMAKKGRPIAPIPKIKNYEVFEYPGHERSPFDASAIAAKPSKPKSTASISIDTKRPPEYLESFPLDSLTFVGTLEQQGIQWGLVKGPDGTIQRVRQGNYMGQNYGQIIRISATDIELEEIVPDGFGGFKKRKNTVALSE